MKNNEHQVIHVDFKAKKKIDTEKYTQYNWVDGFSGQKHLFDSRKSDNVEHIILDNLFVKDVSGQFIKVSLYTTPQAVVELTLDVKETFFKEESQNN